jgi:hypothetical protein
MRGRLDLDELLAKDGVGRYNCGHRNHNNRLCLQQRQSNLAERVIKQEESFN